MAKNPLWQPRRIVISLPEGLSVMLPGIEAKLAGAAGSLELVIDRSQDFVLSAETLQGTDAVIGMCNPHNMMNAGSELLWFQNLFAGMDDCTGLTEQQLEKITFTNGKRLSSPAIAEHTIAMMMALAKGLPLYQEAQKTGQWRRELAYQVRFGELKGKTLLVVGLGGIGTQIAQRASGLGLRVTATRNSSREGPDYVDYVGLSNELHTLAGEADIIVNALPLTAKTTGLFNKEFFDHVKKGAIFLSVGRGKSTVTTDLISALESGQLYAAGLDVTDPEPLPETSVLWKMDNVIITPHIAAMSGAGLQRAATLAVENLRRYVAGEALLNTVDMRAGY
ncbi:MAG: D-2-hydroxyacid dehydrogenase [Halioglobus sp.]